MPKKIQNVTQKIIDAALLIYHEEGFEKISIRKIANISGLAIGTVYNNFEDKNELLAQVIAWDIEKLRLTIMETVFGKPPTEALHSLIYMFMEYMGSQSNNILKFINELSPEKNYIQKILAGASDSINDLVQQVIERVYEEEGLDQSSYSASFIAELVLSMMQTAAKSNATDTVQKSDVIYNIIISYAKQFHNDKIAELGQNKISEVVFSDDCGDKQNFSNVSSVIANDELLKII